MISQTERQQGILTLLSPAGHVDVGSLADRFKVTSETIRRDLKALELQGQLERVHGGAIIPESAAHSPPPRVALNIPGFPPSVEMLKLAQAASALIEEGTRSIFLDEGLAAIALASVLSDPPEVARWTVVSNSPGVIITVASTDKTSPVMLGGTMDAASQSITGDLALNTVRQLRADIAFICADACDARSGLSTRSRNAVAIKRAMIEHSKFTVALCPSTVFKAPRAHDFAQFSDFDAVVTDSHFPAQSLLHLHNQELQVVSP